MTHEKENMEIAQRSPSHLPGVQLGSMFNKYGLLFAWVVTILVFGVLEPDTFLQFENFASLFNSQAVLVVLTYSLVITLTTGEYDLSAAAVMTLSSMVVAVLNAQYGFSIGISILAAFVASGLVGVVNGLLVIRARMDSIIATLGTATFVSGIVLWISGSETITGISQTLIDYVIVPKFFGLSLGFVYTVVLTVVLWYVLQYTPVGRRLLFVGRSRRVSRLSGLNVDRLRFGSLVFGSLLSAFAGILYAGTSGAADPQSGISFLLPAFAAAFLGSTAIIPGRFNAWGSFSAVYFLVTGISGLSIMGIQVFVQDLFYGAALIVAVVLSTIAQRSHSEEQEASHD